MKEAALLYKKKKFINWFMETFRLKRPEAARILKFLTEGDELLQRVHFVDNVRHLPSALIISATDAVTVSFLCRINDVYFENIDEILAHLEYNPPEDLYVWLSFNREFLCSMCDIAFGGEPDVEEKIFYHRVVKNLEKELNIKIRDSKSRKNRLLVEIDKALDNQDKERFMELSKIYKKYFG